MMQMYSWLVHIVPATYFSDELGQFLNYKLQVEPCEIKKKNNTHLIEILCELRGKSC